MGTTTEATTVHSHSITKTLDPEEEAFRALKATICKNCRKHDITSKDDPRLQALVDRYKGRYPSLTPELIEEELDAENATPISTLEIDKNAMDTASVLTHLTQSTAPPKPRRVRSRASASGHSQSNKPLVDEKDDGTLEAILEHHLPSSGESRAVSDSGRHPTKGTHANPKKEQGCLRSFKKSCAENDGFNPLTYTFLLTVFLILAFIASVLFTHFNYNHDAYRDWALAGGVTSTSAQFRIRGPSSDDGKAREFVVSTNSNLAIEKFQISNTPVSYGDFTEEEHFVKRLSLWTLTPNTRYYYGITRPQRTPNSAVVAGDVGSFATPVPEGTRMNFKIATGSCALTGSKADMFTRILDLDPLLFIHMGDFHYEDLNTLEIDERLEAYDKVMGSPSQRLLYMRTIFSYIWDDHDWLGNNQDSENGEAATIAKQAYTLGIPHYRLGTSSENEPNAPKYQAFTIGTVRFIITDLRSESVHSSEYYSGKVYGKEQKQWLFDEFSRAANYDFVVWVSTRPWTDPDKLGSDSWGGFVADRDELSKYIASTIGAGPKNLFVLSGDNHMVAFDDGSSTDYSGQDVHPGGFPLLHSGPLTNYGSGVKDFFSPSVNYFTDGCMAYNSELNYQFSTVDFYFPSSNEADDDESNDRGCILIRSYSKDSSNIIFEKEMCGDLMKYGTSEQDTCTLEKLSVPTYSIFIAAAALILLSGLLALWLLGINGCHIALGYFGIGVLFYLLTIGAATAGALCFGTLGVNMLSVSSFILAQSVVGSLFVACAVLRRYNSRSIDKESKKKSREVGDVEVGTKSFEENNRLGINALDEEDGASATHDNTTKNTTDDTLTNFVIGRTAAHAKVRSEDSTTAETGQLAVVSTSWKEEDSLFRSDIDETSLDKNDIDEASIDKNVSNISSCSSSHLASVNKSGWTDGGYSAAATEQRGIKARIRSEPVKTNAPEEGIAKTTSADAIPLDAGELENTDDSSVSAVLCGAGSEQNSSFESKVASVLSSSKASLSAVPVLSSITGKARSDKGSKSPLDPIESSYIDLDQRIRSTITVVEQTPDEPEGIEVTNPTSRGCEVQISPDLVEL